MSERRLQRPVRLVTDARACENTPTCAVALMLGQCMTALPLAVCCIGILQPFFAAPNSAWPGSGGASHDCAVPVRWLATALNRALTAEGRAAHEAKACGTLALFGGEQAAAGQT